MEYIYVISLVVIFLVSIWAVLSKLFKDNTLQRIALACTCLGCVGEFNSLVVRAGESSTNSRTLLILGFAIYCAGAVWNAFLYREKKGQANGQAKAH